MNEPMPLIVQRDGRYWLRRPGTDQYDPPISECDLLVRLNHVHGRDFVRGYHVDTITQDYSDCAMRAIVNASAKSYVWDAQTLTISPHK